MKRLLLTLAILAGTQSLQSMELTVQNSSDKTESTWDILTDSALTQIIAWCNSNSRNTLMKVSKVLNFFASKQNKDIVYQNSVNLSAKDAKYYLMTGCLEGKFHLIHNLLKNGVNPNVSACLLLQKTPLSCAEQNKHIAIANLLRERGAIQQEGLIPATESPFLLAVYTGDIETIKKYLDQDSSLINSTFSNDATPLHIAVGLENQNVVALLLTYNNLEINKKDNQGFTPLHYAMGGSQGDHPSIVKLLLAHNDIRINEASNAGLTALHLVARNGYTHKTQLLLMCDNILINQKDAYGLTALHYAAYCGNTEVAKLLFAYNDIQVNAIDIHGTPLHWAALGKRANTTELLLAHKDVQADALNSAQKTALHIAAQQNEVNITKLLLAHYNDIQINAKNITNQTAFDMAIEEGNTDIVKLLLTCNDIQTNAKCIDNRWTSLHRAANYNHIDIIKVLLAHSDTQVNEKDDEGLTALHLAAAKDNASAIAALLTQPDIQVNEEARNGATPLRLAMENGHIKSVEILLAHKDIKAIYENEDHNLLRDAIFAGNAQVIEFLFDHEYVQSDEKFNGMTSLISACFVPIKNRVKVIKILIAHGADVHAKAETEVEENRKTPLGFINDALQNGARSIDRQTNELINRPLTEEEIIEYLEIKALLLEAGAQS